MDSHHRWFRRWWHRCGFVSDFEDRHGSVAAMFRPWLTTMPPLLPKPRLPAKQSLGPLGRDVFFTGPMLSQTKLPGNSLHLLVVVRFTRVYDGDTCTCIYLGLSWFRNMGLSPKPSLSIRKRSDLGWSCHDSMLGNSDEPNQIIMAYISICPPVVKRGWLENPSFIADSPDENPPLTSGRFFHGDTGANEQTVASISDDMAVKNHWIPIGDIIKIIHRYPSNVS